MTRDKKAANSSQNEPEVSSSNLNSVDEHSSPEQEDKPVGSYIKLITDPEIIKALSDKTRLQILRILQDAPPEGMTVPEIARQLNVAPPALYHHIDILHKYHLLVEHTIKQKRRTICKYKRSAPVFLVFHMDSQDECSGDTLKIIEKAWGLQIDETQRAEINTTLRNIQKAIESAIDLLVKNMKTPIPRMKIMALLTLLAAALLSDNQTVQNDLKRLAQVLHPYLLDNSEPQTWGEDAEKRESK